MLAAVALAACDLSAPAVLPSPSTDVLSPGPTPQVSIPSPSPVRPPQSPPAGAPAPD
jgi:hypothetical protein